MKPILTILIRLSLATLLIFVTLTTSAQQTPDDTLATYYNKYPRQALADAEKIYKQAIKKHDGAQLIKSLILKTTYNLRIDKDTWSGMLTELENHIIKETDPVVKSLLHSYIAELYGQYYEQNKYTINQYTPVVGQPPTSLNEWTVNIFKEHFYNHLLNSIADPLPLQLAKTTDYNTILITTDSPHLRPTLYDLLAHRIIDLLSQSQFPQQPAPKTYGNILSGLDKFINIKIDTAHFQPIPNILTTYQQLLQFREKSENRQALLIADLERLNYARRISNQKNNDSLYLAILQDMKKQYQDSRWSVEIVSEEAKLLLEQSYRATIDKQEKLKSQILSLCKKTIQQYPDYNRISLLYNIIQTIKEPNIHINFDKTIYPGNNIKLKISTQNINTLTIQIDKINTNTTDYTNNRYNKNIKIPKTNIYEETYTLSPSLTLKDTTISIPTTGNGLYEILVKTPGATKEIRDYFICNQFATSVLTVNKMKTFVVRDRISGKPIKTATILLYDTHNNKVEKVDTIYTDQHGIAETSGFYSKYQVVNPTNPNGYLCQVPEIYSRIHRAYSQESPSLSNIEIITDRKIYRPGQTVHFKGYVWSSSTDTLYTQNHKTYNISFRNNNNKEIATQKVTTNQFGSFAGNFVIPAQTMNGSFYIQLLNQRNDITVADYKRPEFEITLTPAQKTYRNGDSVSIDGKANSYSGIDLQNNTVHYKITRTSYFRRSVEENNIQQGTAITNSKGEFKIGFRVETPDHKFVHFNNYLYKITATITDSKGETQENTTEIPILSGQYTINTDIPLQINKNKKTAFRIFFDDNTDGKSREVRYTISKLFTPDTISDELQLKDTLVEKIITENTLRLVQEDTLYPTLKGLPSGAYLFTVTGNNSQTKTVFYLYAPSDKRPPIQTYNWLVQEKTECKPGENAEILFGTSAKNVYLLYEIYNGNKLIKRSFPVLSNEVLHITFPYQAEYENKIWLLISYVKDQKEFQHTIEIKKQKEDQQLTIQTKVFRNKLSPGQKEQWKLQIKNAKGENSTSEVLAMMYDASLDKIQNYNPTFKPTYNPIYFPCNWSGNYETTGKNYINFYPGLFKKEHYIIPELRFNQLRTYIERIPHFMYADFAEYGITDADMHTISGNTFSSSPQTVRGRQAYPAEAKSMYLKGTAGQVQPVGFRENFAPTAFFYPQLTSDTHGIVTVNFTVPESTTKWKFIAIAHTPELQTGTITRYVTTSKELMVTPNLPRFLRSGDQTQLQTTVSNLTDTTQSGEATFELFQPATGKIWTRQTTPFTVAAGQRTTVTFSFTVPAQTETAGCRISAANKNFSDGEQQLLPVLPSEIMLTETLPFFSTNKGTHTYTLPSLQTPRHDFRLTLEVTANPIWYAVLALPPLTEPRYNSITDISAAFYVNTVAATIARANPKITKAITAWAANPGDPALQSKLQQNSELKSILLDASPWALQAQDETERMLSLAQLFDQNRLTYLQKQALDKMKAMQTPDGGWCWFKGMGTSRFTTLNVLTILARANTTGEKEYSAAEKEMQIKALRYLDKEIRKDSTRQIKTVGDDQLLYLYVRSMYRDIPLGNALSAHKYFVKQTEKQWVNFSFYKKAIAATTLFNYGYTDEAKNILKSLRQYAVTTEEMGTYWPENRNTYNNDNAIMTHTAIMQAFLNIEGNTPDMTRMKQWLLRQKQTQSWKSLPATVDAIHVLLLTGTNQLAQQEELTVTLGNEKITPAKEENLLGYIKKTISETEIKPEMGTVKITKITDNPTWGGLYIQYFANLNQIKKTTGPLNLKKELFIEKIINGIKTLQPVNEQILHTGDKIVVRLAISIDRDMQFLHLQDLRAACLEPENQLSGNHWKFGTVYYQEIKDATTNLFFNALARGSYIIEYAMWVNQSGIYQDGIATLQSIYAPEFSAHSDAIKINVK